MIKRIVHYLLLAAILLGTPFVSCYLGGYDEILEGMKAFPPRTEDWGMRHDFLWNFKRPFHWGFFIGFSLFTLLCLYPFLKRGMAAFYASLRNRSRGKGEAFAFPWWGWIGIGIMLGGWYLSWNRFEWFRPYQVMMSYMPVWLGFILLMNALCVKRSGRSPMTDYPWAYLATFPASSLFWWFFEYLNRYVWNWYYVGISELGAFEYSAYATICFASVLPAVTAVAAWLHTFPAFDDSVYSGMARVNLRRPFWCLFLFVLSAVGLTGIVFFPAYAYPLLWISPVTVFLLVQFLLRQESVLDTLSCGNWSIFFRFAIASLICGFCWETWNYHALAKWVYAVPYVQRFHVWEMPLVGFAGYLPFGVECAAVTAWISPFLVDLKKNR